MSELARLEHEAECIIHRLAEIRKRQLELTAQLEANSSDYTMTAAQVLQSTGWSAKKLYHLCHIRRTDRLPYIGSGYYKRFSPKEIAAWMDRNRYIQQPVQ